MDWQSADGSTRKPDGEGGAEKAEREVEDNQPEENQGHSGVTKEQGGQGVEGEGNGGLLEKQAEDADEAVSNKLNREGENANEGVSVEPSTANPTDMDVTEQREAEKDRHEGDEDAGVGDESEVVKAKEGATKTDKEQKYLAPGQFWKEAEAKAQDPDDMKSESIMKKADDDAPEKTGEGQHDDQDEDNEPTEAPKDGEQRQPSPSHHLPTQQSHYYQPSHYGYSSTQRFYQPKLRLPDRPSSWSSRDTQTYRDGYPGKGDDMGLNDNYNFYMNEIRYRPHGVTIEQFHREMWGNYRELEWNHSYIQWLFPIRERGMNWDSQELQPHEIELILNEEKATARLRTSYKLMLDFYGIKMNDKDELECTLKCEERFKNLDHSSHNYLRITRILKCLGEFGMERLKAPFIRFMLHEAIVTGRLRNVLNSCMQYWVEVLKAEREREGMWQLARKMVDEENSKMSRSQSSTAKGGEKVGSKVKPSSPVSVQPRAEGKVHGKQQERKSGAQPSGSGGAGEKGRKGEKARGEEKDNANIETKTQPSSLDKKNVDKRGGGKEGRKDDKVEAKPNNSGRKANGDKHKGERRKEKVCEDSASKGEVDKKRQDKAKVNEETENERDSANSESKNKNVHDDGGNKETREDNEEGAGGKGRQDREDGGNEGDKNGDSKEQGEEGP